MGKQLCLLELLLFLSFFENKLVLNLDVQFFSPFVSGSLDLGTFVR